MSARRYVDVKSAFWMAICFYSTLDALENHNENVHDYYRFKPCERDVPNMPPKIPRSELKKAREYQDKKFEEAF